jgi:hypothetical protein
MEDKQMFAVKNIFAPKSSRILRVLLVNLGRDWNERELAVEAKVSSGLVHYVCKTLIDLGSAARDKQNRIVLVDPMRLLRRWAAYHEYDRVNKFLEYYTFEKEIDQFVQKIAQVDLKYALSGLAGAWLVAPFVRPVDVHLYISSSDIASKFAEKLELNPTPSGGNVKLVVPYDEGVFYGVHEVRGARVVSSVQLYVDLYNFPARGEEAAAQLLEVMLRDWQKNKEAVHNV